MDEGAGTEMAATLRIGTCSWKYASWQGLVYDKEDESAYLQQYARHYDTVEVDQWFWSLYGEESVRLPRASDVASYRASVPDDFRFSVKVPNSITLTHFYRREKSGPLVSNPHFLSSSLFDRFASELGPLRDVLGPFLFQFEYLNRQKMPSADHFVRRLGGFVQRLPQGYTCAVEVRNPDYLSSSYFRWLSQAGLSPVLLQGYWMPPIASVYRNWRDLIARHRVVVVRLHGPDRQGIEEKTGKRWDRIVAPKDAELAEVADMVRDLLSRGVDVYLNVNNHYEGSAPLTIERVRKLL